MCCATTSRVNDIGKTVQYSYRKVDIGMSVYMDDTAAAGGIAEIGKESGIVLRWKRRRK